MLYKYYIEYFKIPEGKIINIFNVITNEIIKMENNELENGIWEFLIKYDNEVCNFKGNFYKEQSSTTLLFHYFNKNQNFFISYTKLADYSYCSNYNQNMKYLSCILSFSLEDLNELDIYTKINRLLSNEICICTN